MTCEENAGGFSVSVVGTDLFRENTQCVTTGQSRLVESRVQLSALELIGVRARTVLTLAICDGLEVSTLLAVLGTLEENCISTDRFRVTDRANRANLLSPATETTV